MRHYFINTYTPAKQREKMKVEVINYTTGVVETIDPTEEIQPFIYKDRYFRPLKSRKSNYKRDGTSKSGKKEKALYL